MTVPTRSRRSGALQAGPAPVMNYTDWQAIDLNRARKALDDGAEVFALPGRYHSEGVVYVAGLKLRRGGTYLISATLKADLDALRD